MHGCHQCCGCAGTPPPNQPQAHATAAGWARASTHTSRGGQCTTPSPGIPQQVHASHGTLDYDQAHPGVLVLLGLDFRDDQARVADEGLAQSMRAAVLVAVVQADAHGCHYLQGCSVWSGGRRGQGDQFAAAGINPDCSRAARPANAPLTAACPRRSGVWQHITLRIFVMEMPRCSCSSSKLVLISRRGTFLPACASNRRAKASQVLEVSSSSYWRS